MNDEIRKLLAARAAMLAATAAHQEMFCKDQVVLYNDPDHEKYVRYEVEKTKRCRACIAADRAFHDACLAFAERLSAERPATAELERAHG